MKHQTSALEAYHTAKRSTSCWPQDVSRHPIRSELFTVGWTHGSGRVTILSDFGGRVTAGFWRVGSALRIFKFFTLGTWIDMNLRMLSATHLSSPEAVAYLGFQKRGPNFHWPLVLTQRGYTMFSKFFLWWKQFLYTNGGHGPMVS